MNSNPDRQQLHGSPFDGRYSINSFSRRNWLIAGGATVGTIVAASQLHPWKTPPTPVFIAANQKYSRDLRQTLEEGMLALGIAPESLRGKRVLLKPNLVEPSRDRPQMTTHPAVVIAAAELFQRWGALVCVGEAPGHIRDSEFVLEESGVGPALREAKIPFADLNYEQVRWFPNQGRFSKLSGFFFPQSIAQSDLLVSIPKLKTHHWVGMTASLKNLYGTLPGIKYGWPKNVLHHAGIPETVADIYCSLPKTLTIVDGIQCMEGDGPIMGTSKWMGLLAMGSNLPAVDATLARIIGLEPSRIEYLRLASAKSVSIHESRILQRGESWQAVANPFTILDEPHLQALRAKDLLQAT
jgi:uncharacterized protein (DUF362 family)